MSQCRTKWFPYVGNWSSLCQKHTHTSTACILMTSRAVYTKRQGVAKNSNGSSFLPGLRLETKCSGFSWGPEHNSIYISLEQGAEHPAGSLCIFRAGSSWRTLGRGVGVFWHQWLWAHLCQPCYLIACIPRCAQQGCIAQMRGMERGSGIIHPTTTGSHSHPLHAILSPKWSFENTNMILSLIRGLP